MVTEGKPCGSFANALGAIHLAMHEDNAASVLRDHLGEIYEAEGAAERKWRSFHVDAAERVPWRA